MLRKVLVTLAAVSCIPMLSGCNDSADESSGYDNQHDATPVSKTVKLDQRLVMVEVAGLLEKRMPMADVVSKYIETRYVDLNSGDFINDSDVPENYDAQQAAKDPNQSIELSKAEDIAGIGRRENIGRLYLVHNDSGKLDKIIVPVRGVGKFPVIYAFVALNANDLSIYKFGIYQHSETPGLGAQFVDDPDIAKRFEGKSIYNGGEPNFHVLVKHDSPLDQYSIDGVSGATMTSNGIANAINFWCGDMAFGPVIKKLKL